MSHRILTTVLLTVSVPALAQQAITITVPATTAAPLTLITPIEKKLSIPGNMVHASVAFPVTADNHIAIPVGTIAEGQIVKVSKHGKLSHQPWVEIHFTKLLYANGYTVAINATDSNFLAPSNVISPLTDSQTAQQAAAPPPPPKPKGFFKRLFTGSKPSVPKILIAAGWEFQMTLTDPATIDAASASAAAVKPL